MRIVCFALSALGLLAGASCGPTDNTNQNTNQNENANTNANDNAGNGNANANTNNVPPTIMGTSPSGDVTHFIGQSFLVRWDDSDPDDNASISIALQPTSGGDPVVLITNKPEDPQLNTELINTGNFEPGDYWILLTIDDGVNEPVSAYHNNEDGVRLVVTLEEPLTVSAPTQDTSVAQGGGLLVRWMDGDPDDENVLVSIALQPVDGGDPITVREDLPASGTLNTFLIDTSNIDPGVYWVAVTITYNQPFTAFALSSGSQERAELTITGP